MFFHLAETVGGHPQREPTITQISCDFSMEFLEIILVMTERFAPQLNCKRISGFCLLDEHRHTTPHTKFNSNY